VDHLWAAKKCKNYKFTTVYGVLLTLSQVRFVVFVIVVIVIVVVIVVVVVVVIVVVIVVVVIDAHQFDTVYQN